MATIVAALVGLFVGAAVWNLARRQANDRPRGPPARRHPRPAETTPPPPRRPPRPRQPRRVPGRFAASLLPDGDHVYCDPVISKRADPVETFPLMSSARHLNVVVRVTWKTSPGSRGPVESQSRERDVGRDPFVV